MFLTSQLIQIFLFNAKNQDFFKILTFLKDSPIFPQSVSVLQNENLCFLSRGCDNSQTPTLALPTRTSQQPFLTQVL